MCAPARGTVQQCQLALMDTDSWHFWGHTDHQGTLIITISVTAHEERNADNRHFPVYM
ncbi:unnamed protein product [Staurois parvus]|uniref:Uncharacterized protein n=1 Tax=Staurois parvus TaxID=386267 RepID=A0ABN9DME7_9NEOB|nr:unnamed protein product [Staurois parvus]